MSSIHKIKIVPVYRVVRTITIQVELDEKEQAVDLIESGGIEAPAFDNKGWRDDWDLQNEECELIN